MRIKFSLILISAIVPFVLSIILARSSAKDTGSRNELKYPTFFGITGIIGMFFVIAASILALSQDAKNVAFNIFLTVIDIVLLSGCIYLILHSVCWKLTIGQDHLIYRPHFGKIKMIPYTEITRICAYLPNGDRSPEKYRIFYGNRQHIVIDKFAFNFGYFEETIRSQLKSANSRVRIEYRAMRETDNHNEYRYSPKLSLLAIIGLMVVIPIFIMALIQSLQKGNGIGWILFLLLAGCCIVYLGILLIVASLCWRLTVEEDHLSYRNYLGRTKSIPFSNITRVCAYYQRGSKTSGKYRIYYGRHHITIESGAYNFVYFEETMTSRWQVWNRPLKIERIVKRILPCWF